MTDSMQNIPYADLPEVERKRLLRDEDTVRTMVHMYCKAHHADNNGGAKLCPECQEVVDYAIVRTRACPKRHKGNCDDCEIRCYQQDMRDKISKAMAYAGPRMMYTHPVMAVRHLRNKLNQYQ